MKDEIKEILNNIKNKYEDYYVQDIVSGNDLKQLLDYITNLQQEIEKLNEDKRGMLVQLYKANDNRDKIKQENERLKEKLETRRKICLEAVKREQDYKSRCEKALEKINREYYIKEHEWNDRIINEVINILQNGSEEDD